MHLMVGHTVRQPAIPLRRLHRLHICSGLCLVGHHLQTRQHRHHRWDKTARLVPDICTTRFVGRASRVFRGTDGDHVHCLVQQ
jgi:hypothetical protein